MRKFVIATPHRHWFTSDYISGIADISGHLALNGIELRLILNECGIINLERNGCFKAAADYEADFLLFIDSDIIWSGPEAIQSMIDLNKDVVTGIYVNRRNPFYPCIYKFGEKGVVWNFTEIPEEPFTVEAAGCGFMLIRKNVLKAWTPEVIKEIGLPFNLLTVKDYEGEQFGEDIAFCHRLKMLGFEVWADPRFKLMHVGFQSFRLEHFYAYVDKYKEQEKAQNQRLKAEKVNDENNDSNATQEQLHT